MDLKYIDKNGGYIIDRKFTNPDEIEGLATYKESGRMVLSEVLPENNADVAKSVTEFAFDSMKENVLDTIKKKYSVSNEGIYNFYFEGNVEKDDSSTVYVKLKDGEVAVTQANFNLDFEVELKVTPRNFLKVQYNSFVYNNRSI